MFGLVGRCSAASVALLGLACALCGSTGAEAQTALEDMPVRERPRSELDPVGIRKGNVFFFPSIAVTEKYNSNVFATEDDTESDLITVVSPEMRVKSDGTRGGWNVDLNGNFGLYRSQTDENYDDLSAEAGAYYNTVPDGQARLQAGYAHLHESRDSPDDADGIEPTTYDLASAAASYRHRFNRLSAKLAFGIEHYSYDPVETSSGAKDNSDRDRTETEQSLRISYDVIPGFAVFTQGTLAQWRYERADSNRDSQGYRLDGGVTYDMTPLLTFEASAGYLSRDYDDRDTSFSGVGTEARAIWTVTRLTTVTATLNRGLEETNVGGATGRLDTAGMVQVDHELRRDIILSGSLGYRQSEYENISRSDERVDAGVSVNFLLDQGVRLTASANHTERDSDTAGVGFSREIVQLRLSFGF